MALVFRPAVWPKHYGPKPGPRIVATSRPKRKPAT